MTIMDLSPLKFIGVCITAIIVGLVVSLVFVAATAPHPVETPVYVITPVPTPAPVVITQAPVVVTPTVVADETGTLDDSTSEQLSSAFGILSIVAVMFGAVIIAIGVCIGISEDDYYNW